MAVRSFISQRVAVQTLTAAVVVRTRMTYTVTVANSASVNQSLWTVALIRDDNTYILNPSVGTYANIAEIQVNGVAYNVSGEDPVFYTVVGDDDTVYFDGEESPITTRYHLNLEQDTTLEFKEYVEIPTYSATIGDTSGIMGNWTFTFTKGDGTTVVPTSAGTYSDLVSIRIDGLAYQDSGDSSVYYRVYGANNQTYIDGSSSPGTSTFTLNLT